MAVEHVLEIEEADAGRPGAIGEPEQVLGVVVAEDRRGADVGDGRERGGAEGVVLGDERARGGAAGGGGEVPLGDEADLAHQEGAVVGRRRPVAGGRRAALDVGEDVDGGGVELGLAGGLGGAEPGEESVAEVLEQREAGLGIGGEDLGGAEAAGAEPGVDGEEGLDADAGLGRHDPSGSRAAPARVRRS